MEPKLSIEKEVKISDVKIMIGYLFVFYFVWSIKELWLIQYIYSFDETTSAFLEALIKSFIWIVPAWLYIKKYLNTNPIAYLKMNVNVKKGVFWGIVLSILIGLYFAFETYIFNQQSFQYSLSFDD